jgi:hypothetical protein
MVTEQMFQRIVKRPIAKGGVSLSSFWRAANSDFQATMLRTSDGDYLELQEFPKEKQGLKANPPSVGGVVRSQITN